MRPGSGRSRPCSRAHGTAAPDEVAALTTAWQRAAAATPHGQPIRPRARPAARMQTVYSPRHAAHAGNVELMPGEIVPAFESRAGPRSSARASRRSASARSCRPSPTTCGARRVHRPDYVAFLARAWPLWAASGRGGTAMPFVWPVRGLRDDVPPADIDGLLGFYAMDGGATFVEGTWEAVKASQDVALTAAGAGRRRRRAAFALCRPPGHHAGSRFAGGYCF